MADANVIKEAVRIVETNLGQFAAENYAKFYSKIDNEKVMDSVDELLLEMVGPLNASKQIKPLMQLIKNNL